MHTNGAAAHWPRYCPQAGILADFGAAAGLDLTPILVDGTMNVTLSPGEVPRRKRRAPALVAGVPLCQ
jgi:hypothetical protein